MNKRKYRRLPLEHAYNVRDLGGYACQDDMVTKWNTVIRADDLMNLEEKEIDFLLDYGITLVIDLRSQEECEKDPDPFQKNRKVEYVNIPLMENIMTDANPETFANPDFTLGDMYISLIENAQEKIKSVIEKVIENDGGVLFHCAGGKDRTGVIAALLLGAVGVSVTDLVSNYEITYTCLKQNMEMMNASSQYPLEVMMSKAEYIERVIQHIINKYGSVKQYLVAIGISDHMIGLLEKKLCE